MKKQILIKIFLTFIIITIGSCKQDPIFKTISEEEKQLDPHIEGSPTNFVEFKDKMYVASGPTLYRYDGTKDKDRGIGNWHDISIGGNIRQLAATDTTMYALCGGSGKNVIKKSSNGSAWNNEIDVPYDISVQSIYAVNNQVFIGAGTLKSFTIYRLDGNDFTFLTETQNRLLNGAASDGTDCYLIAKDMDTENGSTYRIDIEGTAVTIDSSTPFMGILNIGSVIVAISRNGTLYNITPSISPTGNKLNSSSNKLLATGALAVWTDPISSNKLLLAGRQDDPKFNVNYLHGYQELELDSSGNIMSGTTFRDPGLYFLTTVENKESYKSNMEKNPVKHLFQDKNNSEYILFASTETKGVWSYRQRGDKKLWNAEQ